MQTTWTASQARFMYVHVSDTLVEIRDGSDFGLNPAITESLALKLSNAIKTNQYDIDLTADEINHMAVIFEAMNHHLDDDEYEPMFTNMESIAGRDLCTVKPLEVPTNG